MQGNAKRILCCSDRVSKERKHGEKFISPRLRIRPTGEGVAGIHGMAGNLAGMPSSQSVTGPQSLGKQATS